MEPAKTPKEIMSTREVAEYTGFSKSYFDIGRVNGYGPAFVRIGRAIRYRKEAVDRWLAEHEVLPTP